MITHEGTAMVGLTFDAAFLKHRFNAALAGAVFEICVSDIFLELLKFWVLQ